MTKQPEAIEPEFYVNNFSREGKRLQTDILFKDGAIKSLHKYARLLLPERSWTENNYIITDSLVDGLYGFSTENELTKAGINSHRIVIPVCPDNTEDEAHKSTANLLRCCDEILQSGISKNSCIISLGGGVMNNIAGLVASLLYRGIGLVHIPTTVMAIIDAAIDFKQAVNHDLGKNLIGSYYPADKILIDTNVLSTLNHRHELNGMAEGLKHGLTQSRLVLDRIATYYDGNDNQGVQSRHNSLMEICRDIIELKIPTLTHYNESDYNEMCPQYGHAIGHAIEHLSQGNRRHQTLYHGEALAVGMCISAEISAILGLCDQVTVNEHYSYISRVGLPVFIPETMTSSDILKKLAYDKHYVKTMHTGLVSKIGVMAENCGSYAWSIEREVLVKALHKNMSKRGAISRSKTALA